MSELQVGSHAPAAQRQVKYNKKNRKKKDRLSNQPVLTANVGITAKGAVCQGSRRLDLLHNTCIG
jgi:hypothetical protein